MDKPTIPEDVAQFAAVEYSKAYLYASLFVQAYQNATDALLAHDAYNRNLIGKDREVQRAFERMNEALIKQFRMNNKALLTDFDKFSDIFNRILTGKLKCSINGEIINLKTCTMK